MLVEINLLPEKEPKKVRLWLLASGFAALFLLFGVYFYIQAHSVQTSIESVEKQISIIKKLEATAGSQSANSADHTAASQLKAAVDWAKNYPIQTIPVMNHLTALLPERGFIRSFTYSDSGDIKISVQFDTPNDAAYFLDNLNSAKWVKEAALSSLTASDSNTANGGTASGSTSSSAAAINSKTNTSSTPQNSQTASGTQASNQSNSTSAGKTSSGRGSTVSQPSSPNRKPIAGSSRPASAITGTNADTNQYMPRYTGQFTITLNKDEAKKLMNAGQNVGDAGQGAKGS
ncbi:PilN domain-containing protein [Neobacillus fumarioli]|uniref:PilN domain-containing protein n=1 Tax=Neobacillus fumarioli TaxID=105229 RepID=UPI0008319D87|nr:PilN domain-containing protein [Neobacillus fumarioli]